jgi:hypothetical protein
VPSRNTLIHDHSPPMNRRPLLISAAIALVVLGLIWLLTARWVSGLIDRVTTIPLATLPTAQIGWNGTWLQFGATIAGVDGPKDGWKGPDLSQGSHLLTFQGPAPGYTPMAEASRLTFGVDQTERPAARHALGL